MGRKRRRINEQLPKYVYRKRNVFIYREYVGFLGEKRHYKPDVYLCPIDAPMSVFWKAYERVTGVRSDTLSWLLGKYEKSDKFQSLKPRTQKDYAAYRTLICTKKLADDSRFGDTPLDSITVRTIRRYLDTYPAKIAANRHIQYLKAAWNWARQRYDQVPANPCLGVDLNKQEPRTRYVTQEEFDGFKATGTGYLPLFMELAYLCRARWAEVANLKIMDQGEDGIRLLRGKGSAGEITSWTPRLRAVVDECKRFNANAPTPISGAYLIHDAKGCRINQNAFQSAWGRTMRKWAKAGNERFTFHDLKAKGYSDQKEQYAGHRSARMHATYDRKLRVVQPPE
jgi:hypothetical protein